MKTDDSSHSQCGCFAHLSPTPQRQNIITIQWGWYYEDTLQETCLFWCILWSTVLDRIWAECWQNQIPYGIQSVAEGLNWMTWYHGVSINSWNSCNFPGENVKQMLDTPKQAQSNKESGSQEIKHAISTLIVLKKIPERFLLSSCSMNFFFNVT